MTQQLTENKELTETLALIFSMHKSHIHFNNGYYEIPLFNGVESRALNILDNMGYKIDSIMRFIVLENHIKDVIVRVCAK